MMSVSPECSFGANIKFLLLQSKYQNEGKRSSRGGDAIKPQCTLLIKDTHHRREKPETSSTWKKITLLNCLISTSWIPDT